MSLVPVVLCILKGSTQSGEDGAKCALPAHVRRSLLKLQFADVLEEGSVLLWHTAAQLTRLHLVLHHANEEVLLANVSRSDALPGQLSLLQEDHHVEGRLEVITTTQLTTGVIVHRDVARCSRNRLPQAEGNVRVVVVEVLLAETQV